MTRKALRGASFKSTEELARAIHDFVTAYGPNAGPFVWRKREVKGSQLRNTITNLRNRALASSFVLGSAAKVVSHFDRRYTASAVRRLKSGVRLYKVVWIC